MLPPFYLSLQHTKSKAVGAVFGLTCSKYQSGEIDRSGRISRCGDEMMRVMLYEAAQSMLRSKKWSWLKAWAEEHAHWSKRDLSATRYVYFSNRPFGVKHFQTIHQCSVDVAHGLALLFGLGTKAHSPPSLPARSCPHHKCRRSFT